MGKIFRWDSPFMQKIAMVGNLAILNVLWILCSVPVITAGAATAAMYQVVFAYLTNEEVAVLKPFFQAFAKNFKQATIVWLAILAVFALLLLDLWYMFLIGTPDLVGILIIIVCILFLMVQSHLLPQVARFNTKIKPVFKNAALLTVLHMPSSLMMAVLNVLPIPIFILYPYQFMQWLPLWVFIWFSLVALANSRILLKIWSKHMEVEEKEPEEVTE